MRMPPWVGSLLLLLLIPASAPAPLLLHEDNWTDMLQGEWMVEFFAPWCPACKALHPIWNEFASWGKDLNINVAQIDVTSNPGLSGRFMVTALPTIYHVKDGTFRQYRGSRDINEFMSFIEEKKWSDIIEVSSWKAPDSWQMGIVSYFFKVSMVLRSIHTHLIEVYGIPYWGSYLIFAVATVLVGAILGLILVCVIDVFFPPQKSTPIPRKEAPASAASDVTDDDIILDDSQKTEETEQSSEWSKKRD